MSKICFEVCITYKQLCIFLQNLTNPFNDWSDRSYTQGFAWREGTVSFRSLYDGDHVVNLYVNQLVPELLDNCVRAIRVPFTACAGSLEVGSISDSKVLEIESGQYIIQVEFFAKYENKNPQINIRLNVGNTDFLILKSDDDILVDGALDINAGPAL